MSVCCSPISKCFEEQSEIIVPPSLKLLSHLSVWRRTNWPLWQFQLTWLPWELPTESGLLLGGYSGSWLAYHLCLWDSESGASSWLQLWLPRGRNCFYISQYLALGYINQLNHGQLKRLKGECQCFLKPWPHIYMFCCLNDSYSDKVFWNQSIGSPEPATLSAIVLLQQLTSYKISSLN